MILTLLLLACQSGDLETALAEASASAAQNNFATAVQQLKDAGVEDSADASAWTAYGEYSSKLTEAEISSGRLAGLDAYDAWNDVAWIFENAAACEGAEPKVWTNWSEALLNGNDVGNSLRAVEDGLLVYPKSADLYLQKGRVLMARGRASGEVGDEEAAAKAYASADAAFAKAFELAPNKAAPCLRRGELWWTLYYNGGSKDQDLHDRALEQFKLAAETDSENVDSGMISSWLGAEGIPILDILIQKQPDNALHYWYRGSAYYNLGPDNWPQVRDDFLKVLELNPQFTNAYYFLADGAMQRGTQLSKGGDQAKAEKAFSAAAKFWALYLKDFGPSYRANVQQTEGGGKAAADIMNWLAGKTNMQNGTILLEWAVQTVPDFADAWNNLAFFYRDTGRPEKAREAYSKALELQPEDPQIMNDYAVIYHYYLRSEDELAKSLYTKAIATALKMLDSGEVAEADRGRIQTALRDATNNLKKLEAGNRKNQ